MRPGVIGDQQEVLFRFTKQLFLVTPRGHEAFTLDHDDAAEHLFPELGGQFRVVRQDQAMRFAVMVGPLGAEDHRPPLDGDPASIRLDLFVGDHSSDRHRQIEFHGVTLLPGPVQGDVTLVHRHCHRLAIEFQRRGLSALALVAIEVRRDRRILRPARNAHLHRKGSFALQIDGHGNRAIPWVAGLLGHRDGLVGNLQFALSCRVEIDIEIAAFGGVLIAGNRCDEAGDISRAAGAAEPFRPFRAPTRAA